MKVPNPDDNPSIEREMNFTPEQEKARKMKNNDLEKSKTHTRLEPLGNPPTERLAFTKEQEKARKAAKAGKLGIKFDDSPEKNRWDLLPWEQVEQVVKILTFGAVKYADDNWKFVPDLKKRYFAAAMRHLVAWKKGETFDRESLENHLSHALCCILFLLWKDNQDENHK